MLKKVIIKNFALLKEATIEFSSGFNVLTGETGAGKSLVINALNSILGEKVNQAMLRKGTEKAIVEGYFCYLPEEIIHELNDNEIDVFDDELILRRELNYSGRSRSFINDCIVQNNLLKNISDKLIDLHGQHEHQSLLKEDEHLHLLDSFASADENVARVKNLFFEYKKLYQELYYLKENAKLLQEKKDFLQFQLKEIEVHNLNSDEEIELLKEEKILENHERLISKCNDIYKKLYEMDNSIYSLLKDSINNLKYLEEIDENFSNYRRILSDIYIQIEEFSRFLNEYLLKTDFNPHRLEQVQARLNQLSLLKKKYGLPINEILAKYERLKIEIKQIINIDSEIDKIQNQLNKKKKELTIECNYLTDLRKIFAEELTVKVIDIFHQIGMENAKFCIHFSKYLHHDDGAIELDDNQIAKLNGQDHVIFQIVTNIGEDFKPLVEIVSGGELSRIMLSIKSVLAERDKIGVLVFDEIDIGISGRIAETVGRKLKQLSKTHQIICVTHLPQIACFADRHFSVRKEIKNRNTFTCISELNHYQQIQEIAYLLGGEKITDIVLKNAEEMLKICSL